MSKKYIDNAYTLVREDTELAGETDCDLSLCCDNNGDVSRVRGAGRAVVNERLSDAVDTSNLPDRLSGLLTHMSAICQ